ncbi:MAG TPA: ABC transporter permease [Dehalococcoidia bacterium]|nr:ABC transporter permease [Dehalococcoidia bacterium]
MAQEIAEPFALSQQQILGQGEPRSPLAIAMRRLLHKKIAVIALIYIAIFYAAGISAPLLGELDIIPSYTHQNLEDARQGPSWSHLFGTDALGRDQFSRVIWASQTTVIITVASTLTGGLILTVGLGLLTGYRAGTWIDSIVMRVGEVLTSLPAFLMMVILNATLKNQVRDVARDVESLTGINGIVKSGAPDYVLIFGVLSFFGWVGGARIIRSQVLALRETEFVLAAESLGASTSRILFRHLLPNISNYLIVSLSMGLATAAGAELMLSWFGIGIQPPHPSLGAMIYETSGIRTLNTYPHLLLFPSAVVAGLLFAFNLLGDALTDVFTPKAR